MSNSYNSQIPKEVLQIIKTIEDAGYEAYIVGGCVRDMLMGRKPHDFDITTKATPDEVKKLFRRTYDTGIQHGTVTVLLSKGQYEVTTYRIEEDYKDFRRPEKVSFVQDITLDLARRDFTMNAIAYHPDRGFVDPYKGQEDIKNHIIRCVGDPVLRFSEDALRILRAVRFSAQLGFSISKNTIEGIDRCKDLLEHISKERIRDEWMKICISPSPKHIKLLYELGLLPYIMPEFIPAFTTPQNHPHHIYNVAEHTLCGMQEVPADPILRITMLLHDIGKPYTKTTDKEGIDHFEGHVQKSVTLAKDILKRLRLDNASINDILSLIKNHDYHLEYRISKLTIKKLLNEIGPDLFDKLVIVQEADARSQAPSKLSGKLEQLEMAKAYKEEIINNKECYLTSQLAINGNDLINHGWPKGKGVGEALEKALLYVMENPAQNHKEILLAYLRGEFT